MKLSLVARNGLLISIVVILLGACASVTHITRTQELSATAKVPYQKVLVIALFDSFDPRAYLEKEVVTKLKAMGVDAVASTTMMNSKTPATRATFVAMVEEIGADAVVVSQLTALTASGEIKDMRPEATYNFRPTYYYNVFSVDLQEYVEPQSVELSYELVLATEVYDVGTREPIWGIEAQSRIVNNQDQVQNYDVYFDEADSIVKHLTADGLVAR